MKLILSWLINTCALLALPYLMSSVTFDSVGSAIVSAALLALVNTLLRPILLVLTLPVTVVSMGLFILVINGLMFWLVAYWVEGFHVASFWSAVGAALLYSILSWALSTLLLKNNERS